MSCTVPVPSKQSDDFSMCFKSGRSTRSAYLLMVGSESYISQNLWQGVLTSQKYFNIQTKGPEIAESALMIWEPKNKSAECIIDLIVQCGQQPESVVENRPK